MQSFHNDIILKNKYVARTDKHLELDELIQGSGWNGETGCAVGCTLDKYDHEAYEDELGLPQWLAHLQDKLHEGQSMDDAKVFFKKFLRAIPIGKDLEKVKYQYSAYLMEENLETMAGLAKEFHEEQWFKDVVSAINGAHDYHVTAAEGGFSDESAAWSAARSAWSAARSAASAAESAARSVERSAARSAAESAESAARSVESAASAARSAARSVASATWSAARSAASAAWSAARSAARSAESAASAAWSAAWSAAYKKHADKLLELLRAV